MTIDNTLLSSFEGFGAQAPFLSVDEDYARIDAAYKSMATALNSGSIRNCLSFESDISVINSIGRRYNPSALILNARMTPLAKAVIAVEDVRRNVSLALIVAGIALLGAALRGFLSGGNTESNTKKQEAGAKAATSLLDTTNPYVNLAAFGLNTSTLQRLQEQENSLPVSPDSFNAAQNAIVSEIANGDKVVDQGAKDITAALSQVVNATKALGFKDLAFLTKHADMTKLNLVLANAEAEGTVFGLTCFNSADGFAATNIFPKIDGFDGDTSKLVLLIREMLTNTANSIKRVPTEIEAGLNESDDGKIDSYISAIGTFKEFYSPADNINRDNITKSVRWIGTSKLADKMNPILSQIDQFHTLTEGLLPELKKLSERTDLPAGLAEKVKTRQHKLAQLLTSLTGLMKQSKVVVEGIIRINENFDRFEKSLTNVREVAKKHGVSLESYLTEDEVRERYQQHVDGEDAVVASVFPEGAIPPEGFNLQAIQDLDISEMEGEDLEETLGGVDDQLELMRSDEEALEAFIHQVKTAGGVSRTMVIDLESAYPRAITHRVPVHKFTTFVSPTNMAISLEEAEGLHKGLKVAGALVGAAIIAKLIHWIYSRYGMATDTVKSIGGTVTMAEETLEKMRTRLGKISRDYDGIPDAEKKIITKSVIDAIGKDGGDFSRVTTDNCVGFFNGCLDVLIKHRCETQYTEGVKNVLAGGKGLAVLNSLRDALEIGMTETEKSVDAISSLVASNAATIDASKVAVNLKLDGLKSLLNLSGASQSELLVDLKAKLDSWGTDKAQVPSLKDIEENLSGLSEKIKELEGKAEKKADDLAGKIDKLNAKVSARGKNDELDKATKQIADDHKLVAQIAGSYGKLLKTCEAFSKQYLTCIKLLAGQTAPFTKSVTKG